MRIAEASRQEAVARKQSVAEGCKYLNEPLVAATASCRLPPGYTCLVNPSSNSETSKGSGKSASVAHDLNAVARPQFGGILAVIFVLVALTSLAVVNFLRTFKVRRDAPLETLAPGLTLQREVVHTPVEDIPILTIRADIRRGWKLRLVPAGDSVLDQKAVSQIASTYNASNSNRAPIAVNGGFFAYGGAPVGAVKIGGEWLRLPWKNRTSIGWNDGSKPFIDNLSAQGWVRTPGGDIAVANLNGWPSANACALLTWRVGASYAIKAGEVAALLSSGKVMGVVSGGSVGLKKGLQVLVAGAQAPQKAQVAALKVGESAQFQVQATPERWNSTGTILGAGPRLVQGGAQKTTYVEEEFRPDVLARGPRTMIGIAKDGTLIIMVIEAWFNKIRGMTIDAAASEMQRAGAVEAINLDGGSSTTMWVRGKTITAESDLVQDKRIIQKAAERREVGVANAVLLERDK